MDFNDLFTAGLKPGRPWLPQLPPDVYAWCEGLADAIVVHGREPAWADALAKFRLECGDAWVPNKDTFSSGIRKLVKQRG